MAEESFTFESNHFKSQFSQKPQYSYFDSSTRIYFQRKRKNDLKNKQNQIQKQRRQLAACTFRPLLASERYYVKSNTNRALRTDSNFQNGLFSQKKEKTHQRLIKWGKKRQDSIRSKIIEKQINLINLTRSLSKDRPCSKLDKSLQQTLRSEGDSVLRDITTAPLPSAQQINNPLSNYSTFSSAKRRY